MFRPSAIPIILVGLGLAAAGFIFPNRFSAVFVTVGVVATLIGLFRIFAARGVIDVPGSEMPEENLSGSNSDESRQAA